MHSFRYLSLSAIVVGGRVSASPIEGPTPAITPSPTLARKDLADAIDGISFAEVLLTAVPESLREIAATNIPAVSKILWSEFLDDKRPEWFQALPTEIQTYLVHEFGPKTASASPTGGSSGESSAPTASSAATISSLSATASLSGSSTLATSVIVSSSQSYSQTRSKDSTLSTQKAAPTASVSSSASSTPSTTSASGGLSHNQKIGIGVGIPFAALGAAALGLGCCLLLRRRKARQNGSVPPSSPGFIPPFAFQEKNNSDRALHQPLNSKNDNISYSAADMGAMDWDDDVVNDRHRYPTPSPPAPAPVIKPALFHTHSSNRARGTRTSYTSLHSVPEEREREYDAQHAAAVPTSPTSPVSPIMKKTPQQSRRSLIASPGTAGSLSRSQIKRKPVSREVDLGSLRLNNSSASQSLLQRQHEGYDSGYGSNSTQEHLNQPKSNPSPNPNPFSNDYSYVEDYGAEYHHGYDNPERAWFVNQPPSQTERKVYSKTEWPLRNVRGHQRNRSPMWDRVYDG